MKKWFPVLLIIFAALFDKPRLGVQVFAGAETVVAESKLNVRSGRQLPMDVAPFGLPLPEGNGVLWEDPREIHRVVVHFVGAPKSPEKIRLEYWGSRWPEQHLPKNRELGGGDVGWMELGNWYQGGWRVADTVRTAKGNTVTFTFHPVNAKEFPSLKNYAADFRYTLKLRVAADETMPKVKTIEAFTDSALAGRAARLVWAKKPDPKLRISVFNGALTLTDISPKLATRISLAVAVNSDPNTFDRTLVTVENFGQPFTFKFDDLAQGPLFLPEFGVAVLPETDSRDYAAIAAEQKARGEKTLCERVAEMPEQTWSSAWNGLPPKKSFIYFPMSLDGGRQKFRVHADGGFLFRANDHFLIDRPGKDTPRLGLEKAPVRVNFRLPKRPITRSLEEGTLPICRTSWRTNDLQIEQATFVTSLEGTKANGPVPEADSCAVLLVMFTVSGTREQSVSLLPELRTGNEVMPLRVDENGFLWTGEHLRGQIVHEKNLTDKEGRLFITPGKSSSMILKLPYVILTGKEEREALANLHFGVERKAVADYWRRRQDESAQLITPEPVLNEFYRSHARHLLVNCEREPGSDRRFPRVGSFSYGAYGNESCMMVVDLDRRGLHKEAQECLDAWLHYQGTVGLPGDFKSQDGILYGDGGYEMGGYNQHHGWILWMMAEHFRFTRDEAWLRGAAPGIVRASDWIIRETGRTWKRHELERGLLPAGSLEDIGDWWTWLSTSCYTWRGLDSAAWALEQIHHPDAPRIRAESDAYHAALLKNFRAASQRSPVVRLRDGTAVPKIPSYVHRRGRSFGWICETLEGALHLLITRAMDVHSPEADWIVKDYEDNLYLSNQYGYTLDDFDRYWFSRGGMSMQACLLFNPDVYLYRDDVKHALRAIFNAIAVSHFPDVHVNTEHALPEMGDWRGDHFKSSDEANACGWLRQMFVREEGDELLIGQAVPREWLEPGKKCGLERAATYFGKMSVIYTGGKNEISAQIDPPQRHLPKTMRVRFRTPTGKPLRSVSVNGKRWSKFKGEWVELPPGTVTVLARY